MNEKLAEAKAVAGIEPQMEHFEEIVRAKAKREHREAQHKRAEQDERYYRERRERERNFEAMVL